MSIALGILLGVALFILIVWAVSEIQIRVWLNAIEKHLQNKFTKQKPTVDEEEK